MICNWCLGQWQAPLRHQEGHYRALMTGKLETSRSYIIVSDWKWDTALDNRSPATISVISTHRPQKGGCGCESVRVSFSHERSEKTENTHFEWCCPLQVWHKAWHMAQSIPCKVSYTYPHVSIAWIVMRSGSYWVTQRTILSRPPLFSSQLSTAANFPQPMWHHPASYSELQTLHYVTQRLCSEDGTDTSPQVMSPCTQVSGFQTHMALVIHFVIGKKWWVYFISAMCYQGTMP